MKYAVMIGLAAFHLLFLTITSVSHTITSFFDFYQVDKTATPVVRALNKSNDAFQSLSVLTPFTIYQKYSGAETGYGFFAPNVLSSGTVSFLYKGKKIYPHFNSYESAMRYSAMISRFVSNNVTPETDTAKLEIKIRKHTYNSFHQIEQEYYALVYKNIATKVYADNGCNDTLTVRLQLYDFPTLKQYNRDHATEGGYITLKENKIFLKN